SLAVNVQSGMGCSEALRQARSSSRRRVIRSWRRSSYLLDTTGLLTRVDEGLYSELHRTRATATTSPCLERSRETSSVPFPKRGLSTSLETRRFGGPSAGSSRLNTVATLR